MTTDKLPDSTEPLPRLSDFARTTMSLCCEAEDIPPDVAKRIAGTLEKKSKPAFLFRMPALSSLFSGSGRWMIPAAAAAGLFVFAYAEFRPDFGVGETKALGLNSARHGVEHRSNEQEATSGDMGKREGLEVPVLKEPVPEELPVPEEPVETIEIPQPVAQETQARSKKPRRTRKAPVATPDTQPLPAGSKPAPPEQLPEVKPVAVPDLLAEQRLLQRAWKAASSETPARALNIVAEHQRSFPNGLLTEERDAIKEIANCRTQEPSLAAIKRFQSKYPRSVLMSQVRRACSVLENGSK